jgi:hypothetical protein
MGKEGEVSRRRVREKQGHRGRGQTEGERENREDRAREGQREGEKRNRESERITYLCLYGLMNLSDFFQ